MSISRTWTYQNDLVTKLKKSPGMQHKWRNFYAHRWSNGRVLVMLLWHSGRRMSGALHCLAVIKFLLFLAILCFHGHRVLQQIIRLTCLPREQNTLALRLDSNMLTWKIWWITRRSMVQQPNSTWKTGHFQCWRVQFFLSEECLSGKISSNVGGAFSVKAASAFPKDQPAVQWWQWPFPSVELALESSLLSRSQGHQNFHFSSQSLCRRSPFLAGLEHTCLTGLQEQASK